MLGVVASVCKWLKVWPVSNFALFGSCCAVWNRSNVWPSNSQLQHFFCSVIVETLRNNVGSVSTALPIFLEPRTHITRGLQSLKCCTLPTMHCRSQHYWKFSNLFAYHFQHGRNNSQYCWPNNVLLHVASEARELLAQQAARQPPVLILVP